MSEKKKRRTVKKKHVRTKKNKPSKDNQNIFKKKIVTVLWNVAFYGVMALILAGVLIFNFNDSPTKSLYGYNIMTVKTGSMTPTKNKPELKDGFPAGSLILVKKEDPNNLKVGDIITFFPVADNTDAYLTHRIIDVNTQIGEGEDQRVGFTTQGDANDGPDFPIEKSLVVGKVVWSAKGIGNMIDFVKDKYIVVIIFTLIVLIFILSLRYYLSIPNGNDKKRKKRKTHK